MIYKFRNGNRHSKESHDDLNTVIGFLKACIKQKDIQKASLIHANILKDGFIEKNICAGNTLVHVYAKCGDLEKAHAVFHQLLFPDVVSWTALISGYTQEGQAEAAFHCFRQMQQEGISPNEITFMCVLKSCGCLGATQDGGMMHSRLVGMDSFRSSNIICNALIDMYVKFGLLRKAEEVIDRFEVRDEISWTALIAGYAQHRQGEKASKYFEDMHQVGVCPNSVTYACVLKAYGSTRAQLKGQQMHAKIIADVYLRNCNVLRNVLVDVYAKCGQLDEAKRTFDELPVQDVVAWTALISGYALYGHGEEALYLFETMQLKGIPPNTVTFICILKACRTIRAIEKAHEIYSKGVLYNMLKRNHIVGNALIDTYAKCGMLEKAQEVFDQLPFYDVGTWNSLISGYAQHGHYDEALTCFDELQAKGFSPDAFTFPCVLSACAELGAAYKGQKIHVHVIKCGLCKRHVIVYSALITMYAASGMLAEAHDVFDKMHVHDVISWTSLMEGCSKHGRHDIVLDTVRKMIAEGTEPDSLTFTIILNTCNHSGLMNIGKMYFEAMIVDCGIIPDLEHYTCIIDLLSRAGDLEKAVDMIINMPYFASLTTWRTILSACRKHENLTVGRLAFEHAMQLSEEDASAYICMTAVYTAAELAQDMVKIDNA